MVDEHMTEFCRAYKFIDNHPAFLGIFFSGVASLRVQVDEVCIHGLTKLDITYVYRGDERFDEFLGKGHIERLEPCPDMYDHILVPYKAYYGCEWEVDYVRVRIQGGPHYYCKKHPLKWERIADYDLTVDMDNYEDAIIEMAHLVKELYGDYSASEYDENTIIPKWIVESNKLNPPFKDEIVYDVEDGRIIRSPDNIHLKDKEINALWWYIHKEGKLTRGGDKYNPRLIDVTKYLTRENYDART